MTEIAAKDYVRWVRLAAGAECTLASLLRTKRKSAAPPRATAIQEWESEGGSLPEAGVLPAVGFNDRAPVTTAVGNAISGSASFSRGTGARINDNISE